MNTPKQLELLHDEQEELSVRQINILQSPKQNGTESDDSKSYLNELGVDIIDKHQPIQFQRNSNELVHSWSPYVQGFSAQFVQRKIDEYKNEYSSPVIFDPFAGSGTVLVQSMLNNLEVYGLELNPLLHFISKTKIKTWNTDPTKLIEISSNLSKQPQSRAPLFLKSEKHFKSNVLKNLELIKSGIDKYKPRTKQGQNIKDLMLVAFSSILIDCSNLKRTPCLGYSKTKIVDENAPFTLFNRKIREIAEDLRVLKRLYNKIDIKSDVILANSKDYEHNMMYDLIITSPPYMNGLDYVTNYKIEMGWLGYAENHKELKKVKDSMVVCDNVSKGLIKNFSINDERYSNDWLDEIRQDIELNIIRRGSYRRPDMPDIVHKYFDDMYQVMKRVVKSIRPGGRFILVVGDSLIADVYVPTDLLLAKIGTELGLSIEKVEKARSRRSGQIRTYKLRETIVTLLKS